MSGSDSYDPARRRRATRRAREKGCSVYIPAAELEKAGYTPGGELPWYRIWGSPRGALVKLYRNAPMEQRG